MSLLSPTASLQFLARTQTSGHRRVWRFIASQLDQIEMSGKSVLDLGCWDGYWSFYAERRGARRVLATDDESQNWAGSAGLEVAKELCRRSGEWRSRGARWLLRALEERALFGGVTCVGPA